MREDAPEAGFAAGRNGERAGERVDGRGDGEGDGVGGETTGVGAVWVDAADPIALCVCVCVCFALWEVLGEDLQTSLVPFFQRQLAFARVHAFLRMHSGSSVLFSECPAVRVVSSR